MTFLKYILSFLLSAFFVSIVATAQQSSVTFDVEWLGFNTTQRLSDGEIVSYPLAKDAVVDLNGVLVLQKDVYGKITGSISQENVTYYAGDSASKSALARLTYEAPSEISYFHLYNKGVTTRIYIPLLKKNNDGSWSQISSFSLRYAVTSGEDTPIRQNNPYTNSYSNARTTNATGSVLASGDWFKLAVSQTGIYKIDAAYLSSIGINTSLVNPDMIQIYGNGGGMLPQANSVARLDDLVENAIYISEDGNGIFDNNDYILFYGESPHTWTYNTSNSTYSHQLNIYSDQNFYFLTYNQQTGKRISTQASVPGTAQTISDFDENLFSETDIYNILDSGREWYGVQLSAYNTNLSTNFNVAGLVTGSTLTLNTAVVGRSYNITYMNYKINNTNPLGSLKIPALTTGAHDPFGVDADTSYTFNASVVGANTNLIVNMTFMPEGNGSATAHNNWLELNFLKSLRLYGNQTFFRSSKSLAQATTTYSIGNTDGTEQIWDLSDPQNIISQTFNSLGSTIEFGANSSVLKEYVVLKGSAFSNPAFVERVANQNLHDITSGNVPDMIIVAHPDFMAQAQRLATYRQNNDGISSYICTPAQIYNEFGGGKADITAIRDFVKMVYDRGNPGSELKYLLLFGSCTYDYKNHYGTGGNYVPTYESRESLDELKSYNSDDYFGFLDNAEGNWAEGLFPENNILNIGIGRLPVRSAYQADIVVNKLISASKPSTPVNGNWKNKMTLIADDEKGMNIHLEHAETIYNDVTLNNKQININKIYLDAYPQESTPGGETASLVNAAINRDIDDGTLIWNYIGHGGNVGLAQENIVNISSINSWSNINKLGFYITATCSFGRYDKPGLTSGAETILLSPTGGSFGNLTSTRTVWSNTNAMINEAFYDYAFLRNPDGSYYSLGDIMLRTKNISISGVFNRNYSLLGDPSMKIQYPQQKMVITSVNGVNVNAIPDTLKALSKVTLEGLVQDAVSGVTLSGYNGLSKITIYDKPAIIATYGTGGAPVTTFKLQNNIIFDGLATVTNGVFKVSFIVPKDISYQYDYGKISLYSEQASGTTDAGGYLSNIVIGGSNANAPDDKIPPTVKLYLNDPSFVSGGITRENPIFYADVADENGINVSAAGIGHEITLVLNTSTEVIILNKYYTAAKDDYSKGKVEYPLKDLAPGNYSLRFKVWDTYNNSTEQTLEFTIQSTSKLQLSHVLNYPNPFTTNTTFHFDHNRVGDNLMLQIQIFTVSGKLVKTLDETIYNSPSHVASPAWDGLDDFGDKIGRGVYVYRLKIRSLQDGSTTHVFEKLVLLN
jgi:hypothetical protein